MIDAAGEVIDEVDYQLGFPWPTVGAEPGYSIELIHPSLDNDLGGSWRTSIGNQEIFKEGEAWNFFRAKDGEPSDPVTEWRTVDFDDSQWETGKTPMGRESRLEIATAIDDMRNNYLSAFFRKTFEVEDPSVVGDLVMDILFDDGINVWINGKHVAQENVFDKELPYNFPANSSIENREFVELNLGSGSDLLVPGTNVIAVQVHNSSLTDSDFFFDARLKNIAAQPPGPSPGRLNSIFATTAPPQIRQVDHAPQQPTSSDDVTITAKVTDPDGVAEVGLGLSVGATG